MEQMVEEQWYRVTYGLVTLLRRTKSRQSSALCRGAVGAGFSLRTERRLFCTDSVGSTEGVGNARGDGGGGGGPKC
jgi:hypothetical protein